MKRLLLLFTLVAFPVLAERPTFNLKYGVGFAESAHSQVVTLGFQDNFYKSFSWQMECGGWLDQRKDHKYSATCAYGFGIRVFIPYLYGASIHGVGFLTHPDKLLGSNFAFFHDVGFGIHDGSNAIGLVFKHTSNAGLSKPNIGRNYIAVKVGFGL